jgi:hypothetical protein
MSKITVALTILTMLMLIPAWFAQADQTNQAEVFNGTTYCLNLTHVVVTLPVNASSYNLTLSDKAQNIRAIDLEMRPVDQNISDEFWKGKYIYRITFDRHFQGYLIFNQRSQAQQFITNTLEDGPVRIILPKGYVTGDRVLGIPFPKPDYERAGANGTELIWNNLTKGRTIAVSYYRESAPAALEKIFAILALAAVALLLEYYLNIRRLRAVREEKEGDGGLK